MGKLDFSNAGDFAQATSSAAGLLSGLTGKAKEWDILEGSYNEILFHVLNGERDVNWQAGLQKVQDTIGRRKVFYTFPYVDGQTSDDLGRRGRQYVINCIIHGKNYLNGWKKLELELEKPTPGTLVHPIFGPLTVVPMEASITHESETHQGMLVQITFGEHNFELGELDSPIVGVKGLISQAMEVFKAIDRVRTRIQGVLIFAQNLKNQIDGLLAKLRGDSADTIGKMNATFNGGTSADIPGAVPVSNGGTVRGDGSRTQETFKTAASPSDPSQNLPISAIEAAQVVVTPQELLKEVDKRRQEVNAILQLMSTGEGSLEFYQEMLDLEGVAVALQLVYEAGIRNSRSGVIDYKLPYEMSIREAGFLNGITPDRFEDVANMNPGLESFNCIPKGTFLKIPRS